jgi:hypothetical protein
MKRLEIIGLKWLWMAWCGDEIEDFQSLLQCARYEHVLLLSCTPIVQSLFFSLVSCQFLSSQVLSSQVLSSPCN